MSKPSSFAGIIIMAFVWLIALVILVLAISAPSGGAKLPGLHSKLWMGSLQKRSMHGKER